MIKKILLLILIITFAISCEKSGYSIDVVINDVPDGRKVFLKKQVDRKVVILDSTIIKNGKFRFNGEMKEPVIFGIFIDSIKQGIFPFVNVTDKVQITAYKDSLHTSIIKGSKLNDELKEMRAGRDKIGDEAQSHYEEFLKAQKENDTITLKRVNAILKKLQIKTMTRDWNFIKKNPNSYVAPLVFTGIMTNETYKDSIRSLFKSLSDEVQKSELSKPIRKYFEFLDSKKNTPVVPMTPTPQLKSSNTPK